MVHGGPRLTRAHLVDDAVLAEIEHLARLAPLHNPPAVEGIRSARAAYPGLPQVAAFDTAFFADLPPAAATYAVDRALLEREEVRRYGAHGISHEYVAARGRAVPGAPAGRGVADRAAPRQRRVRGGGPGAAARSTPRWASPRWRAW